MDKDLKIRWKAMCDKIKDSGMTKTHIRSKINVGRNALPLYTQKAKGHPKYPNYVTENVTKKLEKFFTTLSSGSDESSKK